MTLRTPLSMVKGLGAAKEGVTHWWRQRLTAIALVPLTLWFCFVVAALPGADYESVRAWIGSPISAVLLIVSAAVALYHGFLGLQVIIEDYVPGHSTRIVLIVVSGFAAVLLAAGAIFAILLMALER